MENLNELEGPNLTKEELKQQIDKKRAARPDVFSTEIKLPSNGYFGAPKTIRVRRMTTAEEKILYSASDSNYIQDICRACTVDWTLDTSKLAPADIIYILFAIRNITFGGLYTQEVVCPDCKSKQMVQVDISLMELDLLDEDYIAEMSEVKLPDSGDIVVVEMLSEGEIKQLDRKTERLARKSNKSQKDIEFEERFKSIIKTINGEVVEEVELMNKLKNMSAKDYNKIRNTSTKLVKSFGLDRTVVYKCKNCQLEEEVTAVIVPEFFRPNE